MVKERSEIDGEYLWSVDELFTETEWEKEFEEVKEMSERLTEFRDDLDNPDRLHQFMQLYSEAMRRYGALSSYASMKSDEDTRKQKYQGMSSKTQALGASISAKTSFFEPELQSIGRERLEQMMEQNSDLEMYDHYFDEVLRMKKHTRSEEVENVLSELSDVLGSSSEAYSMLTNADIEFPEVEHDGEKVQITQANFTKLLQDEDREFRRKVYEKFYDRYNEYENTVGTTFSKSVRKDVKLARIRDYNSSRHRALYNSNIPEKVYDNLVQTVRDNIDALHSHAELKREFLGVDELGMHDLYVPIAQGSPEIDFEEAKKHIIEALQPLGDDYVERVEDAFEERWIDVYENKGKRSGAYSGGSYDTPPFILMNYQNDISSMYTLAHELGHSMHSDYTTSNQPYVYGGYTIFVAEVASTVNETLLTRHLLETVEDREFRMHVLNHALENFRNTLFRQTMFADFEQRAHSLVENDEPLTPERASKMYGELKEEFYAPADVDDRIKTEWMRIPHFYRAFYVYQYATGVSAATALAEKIVEDGPEDYKQFLKSGSSMYPIDLLKLAGVDMSKPEPVEEAIEVYRQRISEMEELV